MKERGSKYRILSVLISVLMVLTMMPASVFGAEGSSETGAMKSGEESILLSDEVTTKFETYQIGDTTLEMYDRIEFGGESWFILDITGDTAFILSDKSYKCEYDASIHGQTFAKSLMSYYSFGSVTWENSDLRQFLNSKTKPTYVDRIFDYSYYGGGIVDLYWGNDSEPSYKDTDGFLKCFSDKEYKMIEPTIHKNITAITKFPGSTPVNDSQFGSFDDLEYIEGLYGGKYPVETTQDLIFPLSGLEIAKFTKENGICFSNGSFWLRDIVSKNLAGYYFYHGMNGLTMRNNSYSSTQADNMNNVDPACRIRLDYIDSIEGDGSIANPYQLSINDSVLTREYGYGQTNIDVGNLTVNIMCPNSLYLKNGKYIGNPFEVIINFENTKSDLEKNVKVELECNDDTLHLSEGSNKIITIGDMKKGNCKSCCYTIDALEQKKTKNGQYSLKFYIDDELVETVDKSIVLRGTEDNKQEKEELKDGDVPIYKSSEYNNKEFNFYSGIDGVDSYTYDYDDDWLFKSSLNYNYDLIKMSIRVAMASYGKSNSTSEKNYANIKSLMTDIEYDNLEFNYSKPSVESIGYAIGSKNIVDENGNKISVIMVGIRSGGYFNEWGSNVYLGSEGNHAGFSFAASNVQEGIKKYLEKYGDKLPYERKIWISGYSRGAATANLLACDLIENPVGNYKFDKDNIFAFCYETPQGAMNKTSEYKNIVNIVNPIDLVPKVAMSEWGFCRSGITYYSPSLYADGTEYYTKYKPKMLEKYKALLSYNGVSTNQAEKLTDVSIAQQNNMDRIVHDLSAAVKNRKNYRNSYEANLVKSVENLMGNDGGLTDVICSIFNAIPELGIRNLLYTLSSTLGGPIGIIESSVVTDALMGHLDQPHYAELCMSWIDSMDSNTLKSRLDKVKYLKLYINCPVDVTVTDGNGSVLSEIVDDKYDEASQQVAAFVDSDGQKVVIIPEDSDYDIQMSATDEGTVSYIVSEYNDETGEDEHVVSYYDIPVEEGDTLSYLMDEDSENSISDNKLYLNNETVIQPDVDEEGDSIKEWTVKVESEGSGIASGSGTKLNGEYTKFQATPNDGETFLGWYKDGTLISSESSFRMAITSDVTLVAKFSETKRDTGGGSGSSGGGSGGDTEKEWTVKVESEGSGTATGGGTKSNGEKVKFQATPDEGATFIGWYKNGKVVSTDQSFEMKINGNTTLVAKFSEVITLNNFIDVNNDDYFYNPVLWAVKNGITTGTSSTTFSPDLSCTRAQAVTFLWRAAGSPEPKSKKNPFQDVKSSNYYYNAVLWAVEKGITTGISSSKFSPDSVCTRGQIVTFLYRASGDSYNKLSTKFIDVKSSDYFAKAVSWAVSKEITTGISVSEFLPGNVCTRGQIVTFLYRDYL